MDPFAPAWLKIPAPAAATVSSSTNAAAAAGHLTSRQAIAGGPISAISPVSTGSSPVQRSSADDPHYQTSHRLTHGVSHRSSSLDQDDLHHHSLTSGSTDHIAATSGWKQPHPSYGSDHRMRAKAASVSESSRHTRLSQNNNNNYYHSHHNNNNQIPAAAVSGSKTTGIITSAAASVSLVPDFRELASFQFHTRSGSFGSEAAVNNGSISSSGCGSSNSSSGSGSSSTDPCSSEDDISSIIHKTTTTANTAAASRFPVRTSPVTISPSSASTGRMNVANIAHNTASPSSGISATKSVNKTFNSEFPSLAPAAAVSSEATSNNKAGISGSVWDSGSSGKLKMFGGMKKLWVKSTHGSETAAAGFPLQANSSVINSMKNKNNTSSSSTSSSSSPAAAMEILVKNPKIHTSSRSDFFKSLMSSSASSSSTAAAETNTTKTVIEAQDHQTAPSFQSKDQKQEQQQPTMQQQSLLLQHDSKEEENDHSVTDDGKEDKENGIPVRTHDHGTQHRSSDSLLSSSLEAEQRLLKQMGWKEDDEDDFYEPLTEDEVREFNDLIIARKKNASVTGPTTAAASTSAANSINSKNQRNMYDISSLVMNKGKNLSSGNSSCWSGRRKNTIGINSSLASPQENNSSSSADDDDSSSSDEDDDDGNIVPGIRF